MAVQDIGLPDVPGEFRRGTGEEGEAPILVFSAVDPLGIKDGVTHQINGHPIVRMTGLVNSKFSPHGLSTPDRLIGDVEKIPELAVARHDQPDVVVELAQGWGQGTHHIAHSADLDHRGAFRGSEQDAHWDDSSSGAVTLSAKTRQKRTQRCQLRAEPSPAFPTTPADRAIARLRCRGGRIHGRSHGPPSSGGGCRETPWWCSHRS